MRIAVRKEDLKIASKLLSNMSDEFLFSVEENTLKCQVWEPSQTMLTNVNISIVNPDEVEDKFILKKDELNTVIALSDKLVSISFTDKWVIIDGLKILKGSPVLKYPVKRDDIPKASISDSEFKKFIDAIKFSRNYFDGYDIIMTNDTLTLTSKDYVSNTVREITKKFKISMDNPKKNLNSKYSSDYLYAITRVLTKAKDVYIHINNNFPIVIYGKINDVSFEQILAPRIEDI